MHYTTTVRLNNQIIRIFIGLTVLFLTGCATHHSMSGRPVDALIYTNAPVDTVYDVCRQALNDLSYVTTIPDRDNYYIHAYYFHPITSNPPTQVEIEIFEDISGARIEYYFSPDGILQSLNLSANKSKYTKYLFRKIEKNLSNQGYRLQTKW